MESSEYNMNDKKNGWKILGVILIVVVIIETIILGAFIYLGAWALEEAEKEIARENTCSINICKGYGSYWYDLESQICECYEDGVLAYEEFIP